jgi:hypothetical protein
MLAYKLAVLCAVGVVAHLRADSVSLRHSPILIVALPDGPTYEVESSIEAGTWVPTGVLVVGIGNSNVVRMDGFPEGASYRFARVGDETILVPKIDLGLQLTASFTGATGIRFQTKGSLSDSNWTHTDFAFPDNDGMFAAALHPPFSSQAFFRAVKPATPRDLATITHYPPVPTTTTQDSALWQSRFGEVLTFSPIAAMNQNDRFTAAAQFEVFPGFA